MTPPSTPIADADADDVTPAERAAIDTREGHYDGVRIYGDLLEVRERLKAEKKAK